ncbi:MAG: hypothetical protein IT381_17295, partial [Deltaproteobacteria bacterium]|nr:hypothetical protein [Deltaproteobacteria bacterium]
GSFLRGCDVAAFDPGFFGIAAKEALTMDPQQRMLLECVVEALEDAGIPASNLVGSQTGVFVGTSSTDYQVALTKLGTDQIDPYRGTGNAISVMAGRISYVFGLQGPSFAMDTACSSSITALHNARRALRDGECDLAIVAGVNLLLQPDLSIYFSRGHFLAPDGRCKTFDDAANGYMRGEGCGVVVLKRLADAERDDDRIRAVVRGSALNQDGRSGGLTVPNGPAQEAVIRAALDDARLEAADVDYVEAHGTGTSLGDPIEANALANVYGENRQPGRPLFIGSVKTNIGHLESAAGMASLVKLVLALEHEQLPPQLGFHTPSRRIAWDELPLSVVTRALPWPRRDKRPRRAGFSGFAFQGSNAHAIVEEAPKPRKSARPSHPVPRPVALLVLSARSEASLRMSAARYLELLRSGTESLHDVAFCAGVNRSHYDERLAIVAENTADAVAKLDAFLRGETVLPAGVVRGRATDKIPVCVLGAPGDFSADPRFSGTSPSDAFANLVAAYGLDAQVDVAHGEAVPSWSHFFARLAELYVKGAGLNFAAIDAPWIRKRVDLPRYQFDRQRYWAMDGADVGQVAPVRSDSPRASAPAKEQVGDGGSKRATAPGFALSELHALPTYQRWESLLGLVQREVGAVLGVGGASVMQPTDRFADRGLDSLLAVELRNRLMHAFDLTLPSTVALDHPTLEALAKYIVACLPTLRLDGNGSPESAPEPAPVSQAETGKEAVSHEDDLATKIAAELASIPERWLKSRR